MVGRKPKPAALKLLEGRAGHQAITETPKPRPIAPHCPTWLDREAKREWRRLAPALERLGLLTEVDGSALAGYCQAFARWQQAEKVMTEKGLTFETEKGYLVPRPEVTIARQMMVQMRAFSVEFGLTPSSRGRLTLPEVKDASEDNPFDI